MGSVCLSDTCLRILQSDQASVSKVNVSWRPVSFLSRQSWFTMSRLPVTKHKLLITRISGLQAQIAAGIRCSQALSVIVLISP